MYRVNHIMRTINEMSSYTPHMKVNRIAERLSKVQKISFCISVISFFSSCHNYFDIWTV
ncbi:Uncharacterised protein [Escherichia coli]|nr:Uncharacterised protein [Escherichia coli]